MDLGREQELRQTVRLAAKLFSSPIASINIIDEAQQWLKVGHGIAAEPVPLNATICALTLRRSSPMIIPDLLKDYRFDQQAIITGVPDIRFYAAVPLVTREGYKIGTLCVLDKEPHSVTPEQKLMLKILARHAVSIMEMLLHMNELSAALDLLNTERENIAERDLRLRAMFESMKDPYLLLGDAGEILDYNKAAYSFIKTRYGKKLARGEQMDTYLPPYYKDLFTSSRLAALQGERIQLERLADYGGEGKIWWHCMFEPILDQDGKVIGTSYIQRNINDRKLQEEKIMEQNALLTRIAEIQTHDYRGPLATIMGMMNLIKTENYQAPEEYLKMLHAAVGKLDEKIMQVVELINDPKLSDHDRFETSA